MEVKDEIFNILRQNYELRKVISDKIGTREVNVYRWATRKQHARVGNSLVSDIIIKELGITKEDIFEIKPDLVC